MFNIKESDYSRYGVNSLAENLAKVIHEKVEADLYLQLNDFIKRDLIKVEKTNVKLFEMNDGSIQGRCGVRLVLKDKEYIEKLEKHIETLKETINKLTEKRNV